MENRRYLFIHGLEFFYPCHSLVVRVFFVMLRCNLSSRTTEVTWLVEHRANPNQQDVQGENRAPNIGGIPRVGPPPKRQLIHGVKWGNNSYK